MIKKHYHIYKRKFLQFLSSKNNVNISNDGLTFKVNGGYLHIERASEYIAFFNLPANGIIFDVGGGIGATSKLFSKALPKSEIHVFEPIKNNLAKIQAFCSSCKNITYHNIALGNDNLEQEINVTNNVTSSSLLDIEENIDSQFFADSLNKKDSEKIQVRRLDDLSLAKNINILKIDTQGFELEVLKGAVNNLQNINIVVLELANHQFYKGAPQYHEIDQFFRENNFELYDMIPGIMRERKLYEWDSIYVNKKILNK